VDFDNDGKLDLVAGDTDGNVWFFKNIGTKTAPKLAAGVKVKADGKEITGSAPTAAIGSVLSTLPPATAPDTLAGIYSKLHVTDWDGDGKLDILVGHNNVKSGGDEIVIYKNIGTAAEPKFAAPVKFDNPDVASVSRPSPYLVDWDGDGKRDMLVGTDDGKVLFLRNNGTNAKPVFAKSEEFKLSGMEESIRTRIAVVDWNNDGKLDLVVGNYYYNAGPDKKDSGGHVWLFLRK
jgi:large repetitive protein